MTTQELAESVIAIVQSKNGWESQAFNEIVTFLDRERPVIEPSESARDIAYKIACLMSGVTQETYLKAETEASALIETDRARVRQEALASANQGERGAVLALKSLIDAHKRLSAGFGLPYEEDIARVEYAERVLEELQKPAALRSRTSEPHA